MLLVVDIGNTNSVFALQDGDMTRAEWRCETVRGRTADEYFVWLESLMRHEGVRPSDVTAAVVGSVAPGVLENVCRLTERYFRTEALCVGAPNCDPGIALKVDRPWAVARTGSPTRWRRASCMAATWSRWTSAPRPRSTSSTARAPMSAA